MYTTRSLTLDAKVFEGDDGFFYLFINALSYNYMEVKEGTMTQTMQNPYMAASAMKNADGSARPVELPENGAPQAHMGGQKNSSIFMIVIAVALIGATASMHKRYDQAQGEWQQQQVATVQEIVRPESALSDNTRAIQQQVAQMKELMERRREIREMEMNVLRYELGANKPKVQLQQPTQVVSGDEQMDQDIDFARDVAKQAVRQEVEDFLDKVDLVTKVGGYVSKRIMD